MPANYVLLGRQTLSQSAASVEFTNIPQTGYTDLVIKASMRGSRSDFYDSLDVEFNGSAGNSRYLFGDGSAAGSATFATRIRVQLVGNTATSNTFGNFEMYIPNYTSSNNKSVSIDAVGENNATSAYSNLSAGLWSNSAAINSIKLYFPTFNVLANSTVSIYGIAAVGTVPIIAPKATGGDIIVNDGTYWIHTFLSTGAFVPQSTLTCDYLVVAGGGGGGEGGNGSTLYGGGGGGAGGYRTGNLSVASNTNYTITIGGGGAANTGNGTDSIFSTITSTGGGRGGKTGSITGVSGGSGGGSAYNSTTGGAGNTPSTSPSQGNNGGANNGANGAGAGGGGAGAVGITNAVDTGGAGGGGSSSSISGSSVTYAGGGGGSAFSVDNYAGGAGGSGGGGRGAGNAGAGIAGTVNTGGGGGGGNTGASRASAAGGSGIVIIRYPIA